MMTAYIIRRTDAPTSRPYLMVATRDRRRNEPGQPPAPPFRVWTDSAGNARTFSNPAGDSFARVDAHLWACAAGLKPGSYEVVEIASALSAIEGRWEAMGA